MIFSFKYQLQLYAIKKYLNENYKKNIVKPNSLSKLTKKINFYEKKKDLLFQHKFTSKKVFSKTIFKRAKLLSLKRQKIIISKIKSGKKINQSEINFIKNEKEIRKKMYVNFLYKFCLYTILIIYLLITIYPFLWSIFSSFKNDLEIADGSFNPFPKNWTLENYQSIFKMGDGLMKSWIINSFIVALLGTIGNLFFNTFAGYALARIKMPGKNKIIWTFITLMMVPGQIGLITNYLLLKIFGMTNTLWALIIPSLVNLSFIFMSRQFFLNFPREIEEASKIDGQNRISFIIRSVMPLMKPMLMTQAVFLFMGFWNNFLVAKMYIDTEENYTLTVGVQTMISREAHKVLYGQILAGSSISIFPVLFLYTILNSAFMRSHRTDGDK